MYQTHNLGISQSQLASLQEGQSIFVTKDQFNGDVPLPLTNAQMAKISTSVRGFKLKMSSRQIKLLMTGEGWLSDKIAEYMPTIRKKGIPLARQMVQTGLDTAQAMIPTYMAGPMKPFADMAVSAGRKKLNELLERIQKMYGGDVGIAAIDAQYGSGFFKKKLLPAIEKVANILTPYIQEGGAISSAHHVVDEQLGEGFFDNVLSAVETTAKVAGPFMRGKGMNLDPYTMRKSDQPRWGVGFFDKLMSVVKPVARIGANFVPGVPGVVARGGLSLLGNGMKKNESFSAAGLVL